MSLKFLLALAACLPLALAGCGGGGTPAASTASPSGNTGGSGTQTPAAALNAAENAVAAANSAKTAAAVEAARRALDAAVETASAAVETVEADSATLQTVEADVQTYQTEQTAILDGLQPITPASLATVKPAATLQIRITWRSGRRLTFQDYLSYLAAAERHNAAVAAAEKAMARARAERTPVRIDDARRAVRAIERSVIGVREAVDTALETTRTALTRARNYRTEQTPLIAAIQTQPETPPSSPSSSPHSGRSRVDDLALTHASMTDIIYEDQSLRASADCPARVYDDVSTDFATCRFVLANGDDFTIPTFDLTGALRGASDLTNGFSALVPGGAINGVRVAIRRDPDDDGATVVDFGDGPAFVTTEIGGVERYSAFGTEWNYHPGQRHESGLVLDDSVGPMRSFAFGERTTRRPLGSGTWRGAMVGTSIVESGPTLPALAGEAVLTFSLSNNLIDVRISNVRSYNDARYTGRSSFSWSNLRVQSDGRFHQDGSGNNHITGNFYGPEAAETAGVFEHGSVIGAWLAKAPEVLDADN